jgi:hypothetical protein
MDVNQSTLFDPLQAANQAMSRTPVGRLMSPFNATIAPRKLDQAVKVQSDRNPDQIPRLQRWVALG